MSRRWGVPLVLLAASAALSAEAPAPSSGRIARAPEFLQRVDAAIGRGAAWLKAAQSPNGSFADFPNYPGGTTALAYFTLRVCGVSRDDAAAKSAWEALRRDYKKTDLKTYTAALYLMAIAEHGDKIERAKDDRDVKLSPDDMKWATEIARALAGGQDPGGRWWYQVDLVGKITGSGASGVRPWGGYDNSNTQYALLGLKCAARCGVVIDRSVWKRSLEHLLETQEASGPDVPRFVPSSSNDKGRTSAAAVVDHARGWTYATDPQGRARGRATYPSMTAAGVSSIVICRSELMGFHEMTAKLENDSEKAAWDGLAWLGTHWNPSRGGVRRGDFADYYESYGVERAGVLAAVEWMAGVDWYGVGAAPILDAQTADGAWVGQWGAVDPRNRVLASGGGDVVDTCFALLFLKKGTAPVRMGAVTQLGGDVDINFAEAAKATGKDLEDVVDLVLQRWRRASDEGVKARIFDGAASVGPRIVEPLLVRMDSPEYQKRLSAHALLKRATGLDFGWNPEAEPAAREEAVVQWQTWWMGAKDKVEYDAASKRLVVR
jgi:hypothetical protein